MGGEIRHGEAASGGYFTALAAMLFFVRAQRQITVVLEQHTALYFSLKLRRRIDGRISVLDARLTVHYAVHVDPAVGDSVHDCYADCRSLATFTVFPTTRPLARHGLCDVIVFDA